MLVLALRAYLLLIGFDLLLISDDFAGLYKRVRRAQVRVSSSQSADAQQICVAMNLACIWYWKKVLCLQRSAATVCLLRSQGHAAQMVIGAQQVPFKAHAWVEMAGQVVNDKPYTPSMYAVLDRC